jgi:hypothetical protein
LGRDALVRDLAGGLDWGALVDVAGRHRIEGLVFTALRRAGVTPPPPFAERLGERAAAIARRGLQQAAESVRLQRVLDAAGAPNLIVKGVALDALAWGRLGLKQAWDIDILVDPGDVETAAAVLARQGYAVAKPKGLDEEGWRLWVAHAKEGEWVHGLTGAVVELHWRLTDAATLLPGLTARSPGRTLAVAPGSPLTVRTLPAPETFAYLCVHGTSHAWSRLKWLADVGALVAQLETSERLELHRAAVALGAGRCSAVTMALCARLLQIPLPPALADEIRGDWRTRALVALAMEAVRGGGSRDIADRRLLGDAILLSRLLFADGAAFLKAEFGRLWPSLDDRLTLRLPPSLDVVYALARLPLWGWRRIGRAGQTGPVARMLRAKR